MGLSWRSVDYLAFETAGDIVGVFVDWILPVAAAGILTALFLWVLAYMARLFVYLKAQESRIFTRDTLDFMRRFFSLCAVIFYVIGVLLVLQSRSDLVRAVLTAVIAHVA